MILTNRRVDTVSCEKASQDSARNTVVETYWKFGKRIVEEVNYFGVLEYLCENI